MRAFACAVLFLTRIPLPQLSLSARDVAHSPAYFAWVGVLMALLLAGAAWLLTPLGPRLASLLLVVLWILLSGGLHLDGLADTVDGLSGGRGDRQRALTIMRDSRIGAHGALALVLLVLLKWAALEQALELARPSWLVAPVVARFSCTAWIAWLPYARSEGLASPYVGAVGARALAIGAAAVLLACVVLGPSALLVSLAGSAATSLFVWRAARLLGGLTGDVYGAAIELAELGVLLAVAVPGFY